MRGKKATLWSESDRNQALNLMKVRRKEGARARKTSSIKCGCPFRVNAIYKKSLDVWTVDVRKAEHNQMMQTTCQIRLQHCEGRIKQQSYYSRSTMLLDLVTTAF